GVELSYDLAPPQSPFVPVVGLGVLAAHITATGMAQSPYVSASNDAWRGAGLAHAGVAWTFARAMRLRLDRLAAFAPAPVHVGVGGRDVGTWGEPAFLVVASFEVLWAP